MGIFSKENFEKLKNKAQEGFTQAVETTTELAKKTKDVAVDVYENAGEVAANLQVKALNDNLNIAYVNWLSVYADEMLNGNDPAGKGSNFIQAIKANLNNVQVSVKTKGARVLVAAVIADLDTLTGLKNNTPTPEALYNFYETMEALPEKMDNILEDEKVIEALKKQDAIPTVQEMVEIYDFDKRSAAVDGKCNLSELTDLYLLCDKQAGMPETINKTGVEMLRELCQTARSLANVEGSALADINSLSNEVSLYNLRTTVSGGAAAYAEHYAAQIASGAAKYTGQAMSYLNGLKKG
tara:strand:- start:43572 stop:44459 length:888 start_codon:yes stop_codon:yes gene_type:complete